MIQTPAEDAPWPTAEPTPSQARIVVIDDEPLNAVALTDFLRGAGFERISSYTGEAATVEALRDEQPDLVLLELALQRADAYAILGFLRGDRVLSHVPVIVLTTVDDRASRLRALTLGAADFLVKPIDAGELDLRLRNTLAAKAYRDHLAHTDQLTGLPNRESLLWRLEWALRHALRHGTSGAVLQVGLDRFKQVNDALGPAVGDELLQAVSRRLVAGLRDSDMVTRTIEAQNAALVSRGTGDEFTVLLPAVERAEDAAVVAQRMIERMAAPFAVGGQELFISCRVGMAVFPGDSSDKDTVLQHAGVAMRHARQTGSVPGRGFQFYSDELNAQSMLRLSVERELHHALTRDELVLYYQPQMDLASGRLCGAEALVRWQHPQRGLLGPDAFIAVAEQTGQIERLGHWVLREALRQTAAWRRAGLVLPQVAVNVSSLQLQRTGLCEAVTAALAEFGLPAQLLCLELTESAVIDSGPQVTQTLAALKHMGVRLALDDFGTGYSSLTYLRRMPLDELKIDRSFVSDCDSGGNGLPITAAIIAMAHRLGLRVVAEGVETPQQLAFLRASQADSYQGYLFARPLPAAEFAALLAAPRSAVPWHDTLAVQAIPA